MMIYSFSTLLKFYKPSFLQLWRPSYLQDIPRLCHVHLLRHSEEVLDHPGKNKGKKKKIKNWGDQDICELQHNDFADCPTFWKCNLNGIFFNQWWIPWTPKAQAARGDWGPAPPENFDILMLWRGQLLSEMFAKSIVIFKLTGILICMASTANTWFYFVFRAISFLDISFSWVYSVRCCCIRIIRIHLKISEQLVKIGIFPTPITYWSRFRFSHKIRRIPTRSGWLDSLPLAP